MSALDTPGAIVQHAYTVADIESAALEQTRTSGIGPWFLRGPFTPPQARYRGAPSTATFTLARAFLGPVMVELIQQHGDEPSVFRERPLGLHHWATMPADFDAELARLHALGFESAFEDVLPTGARITYVDTRPSLRDARAGRADTRPARLLRAHPCGVDRLERRGPAPRGLASRA